MEISHKKKKMNKNDILQIYYSIILLTFVSTLSFGQVSINMDDISADESAILDVQSLDQGVLIPRLATVQRTSISNPADGLLLFDTDSLAFFFAENDSWKMLEPIDFEFTTKRSVFYSATSLVNTSLVGSGRGTIGNTRVFFLPPSAESFLFFNLPIPTDYKSGFLSVKLLYTSNATTGNFRVNLFSRDHQSGTDLNLNPGGGGNTFPAPNGVHELAEYDLGFLDSNPSEDIDFIYFELKRQVNNPLDTCDGQLHIIGFVLEYDGQ